MKYQAINYDSAALCSHVVIFFESAANATYNVAGLPAAARAVREVAAFGVDHCWIATRDDWHPDPDCRAELARMAGAMGFQIVTLERQTPDLSGTVIMFCGEDILSTGSIRSALLGLINTGQRLASISANSDRIEDTADSERSVKPLDKVARRIIAETGKPGDGIVSRTINRPISRAISRQLLRWPAIRPLHATLGTALLGMAMLVSLLTGGNSGLVVGALLFQAASIFDGVDGEIARATFRSSSGGAMADSLIDAATNIGFVGGVSINLWNQGYHASAMAGGAGLAMMALGLFLIGRKSQQSGNELTFNGIKDHFREGGSRIMMWLTWLTMRDFYALVAAIFVVSGFAVYGLIVFAVIATGWFAVVNMVLTSQADLSTTSKHSRAN